MFDIKAPENYFYHIKNSIEKYKLDTNKKIERLFFIINGLNHLREWIAPNYDFNNKAENDAQKFYNDIYVKSKYFKDINNICNGIKHLKSQNKKLKTSYNSNVDEWENVDNILDVDIGIPSDYYVDDKNIIEIIEEVAKYYEDKWFIILANKK
jgi:hypothetical protein